MPTSDCPGRIPTFVAPSHSNHQRCPGYIPGRVAPVRSPPPAKAPPPPPLKPHGLRLEQRTTPSLSVESQRRGPSLNYCMFSFLGSSQNLSNSYCLENCPDHHLSLSKWNPGHQPNKDILIRRGDLYRLESSATFRSLTIQSGGRVVFADNADGTRNITLRTHYILIEDGGALHIGSPKCRYRSRATIALLGRSDSKAVPEIPVMGRKFIGVMGGGTLELHGTERVSWSLLTRSIPSSGLSTGGYAFQKNFSRGINFRVFDQDTSALIYAERFDTHNSRNDSRKLTQLLRSLPAGRIVALAVGDSAVKGLLEETKKAFKEVLGSQFDQHFVPRISSVEKMMPPFHVPLHLTCSLESFPVTCLPVSCAFSLYRTAPEKGSAHRIRGFRSEVGAFAQNLAIQGILCSIWLLSQKNRKRNVHCL
uniref:G8 domain-containing protein n=1 Tax=Poecilia mexicana TaxID=48701 RepID=A0A3B3YUT1_9TELE